MRPDPRKALLRRPEVSRITGLSANRIDELEKAGQFPRRVLISTRAVGWVASEVESFIDSKIAARDAERGPSKSITR